MALLVLGKRVRRVASQPQEYQINGGPTLQSLATGKDGRIWVTTRSSQLVGFAPEAPAEQTAASYFAPQYGARILADPYGNNRMWFAAPATPNMIDPVFEFNLSQRTFTAHPLQREGTPEDIALVKLGTETSPRWMLAVSEPKNRYVALLDPKDGNASMTPAITENTWLWGITVAIDPSTRKQQYWVAGQSNTAVSPAATVNGIFRMTVGASQWDKLTLPNAAARPVYLAADEESVWVTTQGSGQNLVWRYDLQVGTWTVSDQLQSAPWQLVFGPNKYVWVAAGQYLYKIAKADIKNKSSIQLPPSSSAMGICVGPDGNIWYTNQSKSFVGMYPLATLAARDHSLMFGQTQLVEQPQTSARVGTTIGRPLTVEFVATGRRVPGIPLTCRLDGRSSFADGGSVVVITTDVEGRAVVPDIVAGPEVEELGLSVGLECETTGVRTSIDITKTGG
ncbi:hypothetical protein ACFCX4_00065 [Kitasatospora sp. NPDC056327]|uniref:Vgb family protein n=1 Tax=Kitasatospora sp. NPDC056327 TaxID=3345785 RepID=UPI0035D86AED